jgi:hypothetical protein
MTCTNRRCELNRVKTIEKLKNLQALPSSLLLDGAGRGGGEASTLGNSQTKSFFRCLEHLHMSARTAENARDNTYILNAPVNLWCPCFETYMKTPSPKQFEISNKRRSLTMTNRFSS